MRSIILAGVVATGFALVGSAPTLSAPATGIGNLPGAEPLVTAVRRQHCYRACKHRWYSRRKCRWVCHHGRYDRW